jgi:hypothetical protein
MFVVPKSKVTSNFASDSFISLAASAITAGCKSFSSHILLSASAKMAAAIFCLSAVPEMPEDGLAAAAGIGSVSTMKRLPELYLNKMK